MRDVSEKLKTWWREQDESEKVGLIKDKSILLNKELKQMLKASAAEFNYTGARTGIRGGRKTTLSARTQDLTRIYQDSLNDLKYMVSNI